MQFQDDTKQKEFLKKYQGANRKMEEDETSAQASGVGLPYMDLSNFPIDLNAISVLTKQQAEDSRGVVFYKDGLDIRVGTCDPVNLLLRRYVIQLEAKGYHATVYLISESSYKQAMPLYEKVFAPHEAKSDEIKVEEGKQYSPRLSTLDGADSVLNATQILEILFGAASEVKASDIHLEPEENFVKVRFRVDGVLSDVAHLSKQYQKPVISRIKILSKLKINVENKPQDGRFSYIIGDKEVDVRISVLPSANGEGIVMRILAKDNYALKFEQLGFIGRSYDLIKEQLQKPNGMIVTTGPTGSGKTTTLYAFLKLLNQPGVKIITLEDPIEYKLEGINQTPIDPALSFAAGLRAILRQDPDIIMVGEIRDQETAETALQAALTGHVVLSTLHTNDAAGAIPRLLNMGVKPFVISPAINAIIAQRLVRKLCVECKKETKLDPFMLDRVKKILAALPKNSGAVIPKEMKFYHAPGCKACNNTGYSGRIGVYEVIVKSETLEKLIISQASTLEIKKAAIAEGMITMAQDGLLKALAGITDVEEVFRVTE